MKRVIRQVDEHAVAVDSNGFVSFIEQKIFQIPILFAIIGLAYLRALAQWDLAASDSWIERYLVP